MLLSFMQLLILLVLVVITLAVGVIFIPKIAVLSAPQDIKKIMLAREDYPKWRTILGIILLLILFLLILGIFIWAGVDAKSNHYSFSMIFIRYLILFEGYKIFDMICFDYILLTKLNVFQKMFPETIGCKGYESYGFNLKSQTTKLIVFAIISYLIALILINT